MPGGSASPLKPPELPRHRKNSVPDPAIPGPSLNRGRPRCWLPGGASASLLRAPSQAGVAEAAAAGREAELRAKLAEVEAETAKILEAGGQQSKGIAVLREEKKAAEEAEAAAAGREAELRAKLAEGEAETKVEGKRSRLMAQLKRGRSRG